MVTDTEYEGPGTDLEIRSFMHCGMCLDERPEGVSPMDWSRTQTGWTWNGLQVWCNRHNVNVCNIDLMGHKITVNTHRSASGRPA